MTKKNYNDDQNKFYTSVPNLSGEEECIARAGEGSDPWINQNEDVPIIYKIRPLDKDGQLTPQYKKLIEQLHMVDLKPIDTANIGKSESIDKDIKKWRRLKKRMQKIKNEAQDRIEKLNDGYLRNEIKI